VPAVVRPLWTMNSHAPVVLVFVMRALRCLLGLPPPVQVLMQLALLEANRLTDGRIQVCAVRIGQVVTVAPPLLHPVPLCGASPVTKLDALDAVEPLVLLVSPVKGHSPWCVCLQLTAATQWTDVLDAVALPLLPALGLL